jgi:hypothetical protein
MEQRISIPLYSSTFGISRIEASPGGKRPSLLLSALSHIVSCLMLGFAARDIIQLFPGLEHNMGRGIALQYRIPRGGSKVVLVETRPLTMVEGGDIPSRSSWIQRSGCAQLQKEILKEKKV